MSSHVEQLFLDDSYLDINILQKIGALTSLKTLSLSDSGLTGSLPGQGKLLCLYKQISLIVSKDFSNVIFGVDLSVYNPLLLAFLKILTPKFNVFIY